LVFSFVQLLDVIADSDPVFLQCPQCNKLDLKDMKGFRFQVIRANEDGSGIWKMFHVRDHNHSATFALCALAASI
jgi:hypothetical protein